MTTCRRDNTTQPRIDRQSSPGAVWAYCLIACLALGIPAYAAADAIEHIVIVWLREPGNTEQRARIISESQILRQIPGVTGLRAGGMLPSQRSSVDSSFDVALIVSLRDAAAMADYLAHPIHVNLLEDRLAPPRFYADQVVSLA
jgi:Stress responsive A/B Barrel Domain